MGPTVSARPTAPGPADPSDSKIHGFLPGLVQIWRPSQNRFSLQLLGWGVTARMRRGMKRINSILVAASVLAATLTGVSPASAATSAVDCTAGGTPGSA